MPDGDDSFYANWASPLPYEECLDHRPSAFGRTERAETYCVRRPRYEDYLARDLVAHVDATYRTVADRSARAVEGLSMGGFGAMMLAMRHQDVFSAAISHSGVVSLLYAGPHPYQEGAVTQISTPSLPDKPFPEDLRDQAIRVFGANLAGWRAHDPATLATKLKDGDLALYFDCGTEDGFKLHDEALHLHEVLGKAGVTHTFQLVPGGHSFALWKERIDEGLAFAAAHFTKGGY
jgi:S-formylglutathione hydrolase FrmB